MSQQTALTKYSWCAEIQVFGVEIGIRRIDRQGSYEEMKKVIENE